MSDGRIRTRWERLDERFAPIGGDRYVEVLFEDGRWLEGPAYSPLWRSVLFSDIPNDRVMRWDETTGAVGVWRSPAGYANGRIVDRLGRVVHCHHGSRSVTRVEPDGSVTTLADAYEGRRLNSPNDLVERADGSIWFTDPSYGIHSDYEGHQGESETDGCHVYRVDADGSVTRVADDFAQPNGLAFSADERELYVVDSERNHVRRFDVAGDGSLDGGEVLVTADTGGLRRSEDRRRRAGSGSRRMTGCTASTPTGRCSGSSSCPRYARTSPSADRRETSSSSPRPPCCCRSGSPAAERRTRSEPCQALDVSLLPAVLLVPAGVVAGVVGSAGGITSLISYPALLAAGVPPLPANVGNIVAAVAIGPGSALSSRSELAGTRPLLVRLLPVAAVGSVAGGAPAAGHAARASSPASCPSSSPSAPWSFCSSRSSCRGGAARSWRWDARRAGGPGLGLQRVLRRGVGGDVPGGGAVLRVPGPAGQRGQERRRPATCAAAALVLILVTPVPWASVVPLAAGLLVGSALGPVLVRRMPGSAVRWFAATLGFGLAVYLWFQAA